MNPSARLPGRRLGRTVAVPDALRGLSDGRAGETALVLGSFRHRPNGDWDFVLGGKGYARGLEELLQDYGIEVE
ncbi:hypothetical protein DC008_11240 [Streptomyces nigra]|nr:hypothetical protein DC008_11240 [Streptomyces nigra]